MPRFRKTFAIGDIHGDIDGLHEVILAMYEDGMDLSQDLLVFLGDYVDGFDEAASVVYFIRDMLQKYPDSVIALKGNHEDLMLNGILRPRYTEEFKLWWYQGGEQTYKSYDVPALPDDVYHGSAYLRLTDHLRSDLEWMAHLPTLHETEDFYFVHAGLYPGQPVEQTRDYDRIWLREPFLSSNYDWGKPVVHGHSPVREPEVKANRINLNTRSRVWGHVTGAELFTDKPPRLYKGIIE